MWRWLVGFLKSPIVERRDSFEPPCWNFGRPSSIMRQQSTPAARYNQAVFVFRLAREATGHTSAAYSTTGGQLALSKDSEFAKAFTAAKARCGRWICGSSKRQIRYSRRCCRVRNQNRACKSKS